MKFARDGFPTIIGILFFSLILVMIGWFLASWFSYLFYVLAALLGWFVLYFFRDPDRITPIDENLLIAPADGKVLLVHKTRENKYIKGPATQISIFLSPLNVHVNRIPATGTIESVDYIPGKYLVAWHEKSSELNERSEIGMVHTSGTKIYFKQITGYIARRITFHVKGGDKVKAGDRFGMMKFGSRMDILVPENVEVYVKAGDKTIAGESLLGKFT